MGMRILFLNPPTGIYLREDRCQIAVDNLLATPAARTPLDLAYPAGTARSRGGECMIRDYPAMGLGWGAYLSDLESFRPEAVFISTTLFTIKSDLEAATLAKRFLLRVLTIAKGPYFIEDGFGPFDMCPELDVAIAGETEMVMADIAQGIDPAKVSGVIYRHNGVMEKTPDRPVVHDLDELGLPARDLLDNSLYVRPDTRESQTTVLTNRGCPHQCIYCLAHHVSGHHDRWRSPAGVVAEIEECVDSFGIRNFFLEANEFTLRRQWVVDLCDRLVKLKKPVSWVSNSRVDTIDYGLARTMKTAGCWLISFGVESGSQDMLDKMQKGITLDQSRAAIEACRRAGILTYCYFIFGLPWESHHTAQATIRFAVELDPDFAEFYVAYPFKGTELHDVLKRENLFLDGRSQLIEFGQNRKPAHRTHYLSPEDIDRYIKVATRKFYLRPGYVLKQLKRVRDPKILGNYLRYGLKMLTKLAPKRG